MKKQFGFYPEPLQIEAGPIRVYPLPDHDNIVETAFSSNEVTTGWIYAPIASRVFPLPKTHVIEHARATSEDHLDFLVWALSFFTGIRLTTTDAGFLDATPAKPGTLVDFFLADSERDPAIRLADTFWTTRGAEHRHAKRFAAAIHALFLGQNRDSLEFERFIYLYTAIDACYALTKAFQGWTRNCGHFERIALTCRTLGVTTPDWAQPREPEGKKTTAVSAMRNFAIHEAIFVEEPLGFALLGSGTYGNLTLEMRNLVCRFLVALINGNNASYLKSAVDTQSLFSLTLS